MENLGSIIEQTTIDIPHTNIHISHLCLPLTIVRSSSSADYSIFLKDLLLFSNASEEIIKKNMKST